MLPEFHFSIEKINFLLLQKILMLSINFNILCFSYQSTILHRVSPSLSTVLVTHNEPQK